MEVTFNLSKEDYLEFNMSHMKFSKYAKRAILVEKFGVPFIFLIIPFILKESISIPFFITISIGIVIFLLWIFFYDKFLHWKTVKNFNKLLLKEDHDCILGEQTIRLEKLGLIHISNGNRRRISWNALLGINETDKYIFIYANSTMAHIIPKRAFSTKVQLDKFIKILKSKKDFNIPI